EPAAPLQPPLVLEGLDGQRLEPGQGLHEVAELLFAQVEVDAVVVERDADVRGALVVGELHDAKAIALVQGFVFVTLAHGALLTRSAAPRVVASGGRQSHTPTTRETAQHASEASPRGVGPRSALPNGARGAVPSRDNLGPRSALPNGARGAIPSLN